MTIDREIKFNRQTKGFDCFVDGRYVGSRGNYRDGDMLCDQVAYDLIEEGYTLTATELDDVPTDNPDVDSTPGTYGPEQASCTNCHAPHHIQKCPQIHALLFAPVIEWSAAPLDVEFAPVGWAA